MIEIREKDFLDTLSERYILFDGVYWGEPVKVIRDLLKIENPEINEHRVITEETMIMVFLARWVDEIKKWVVVPFSCFKGFEGMFKEELNRVYLVYKD